MTFGNISNPICFTSTLPKPYTKKKASRKLILNCMSG